MFEFGAHSVTIHTIETGTAVKLGGIVSMGMPLNNDVSQDDNGQIYDSFVSLNMQAPTPQFGTKSVAAALAAIPQTGICLNTDGTHPGVKLYGQSKGNCRDGEPTSAQHLSYLIDAGLLVPLQLSGSRREAVRLTAEIDAITPDAGVSAPFAANYAETLPTALNIDEYVLGAMRIGNILWEDARNLTLDFNVTRADKEPQLGGIWPDTAARVKARPTATITGRDPTKLHDATGIPLTGKVASHADTILYFRKKSASGLEAIASTVHFRMTLSGLVLFDNPFSASGAANAETTVMWRGIHDGTNAPIIFQFGIAYDPTP